MKQAERLRAATPPQAHLAGWLDLLGSAVMETAPRIQRIHLQIAETAFEQVSRLAPTRPVVGLTRGLHHLISEVSYTSVRLGGAGVSRLAQLYYRR